MIDKAALASCPKSNRSMLEEADCESADFAAHRCQSACEILRLQGFNPPAPSGCSPERRAISSQDSLGARTSESKANRTSNPPGSDQINRDAIVVRKYDKSEIRVCESGALRQRWPKKRDRNARDELCRSGIP